MPRAIGEPAVFTFQHQGSRAAMLSDANVVLEYRIEQRHTRNVFVAKEVAAFDMKTSVPISAQTLLGTYVRPLHEMIAFCVDRAVDIRDFYLTTSESDAPDASSASDALFVFSSSMAPRERRMPGHPDLLFSVDDLGERFEGFIQEWFSFRNTQRAFCGSFFGLSSGSPRFLEMRFAWLARCVRLLATTDRPTRSGDEIRRSFEDSVDWLLNEVSELHDVLFGVSSGQFADALVEAHLAIDRGEAFDNVRVAWLAESLKWILKGFILLRLPGLEPRAAELLLKNPQAAYAKDQVTTQIAGH